MAVDLGSDISFFPDLDPGGVIVSGTVALCQRLANRYRTPRSSLWYAPNYGFDVRAFLNAAMTQELANSIKAGMELEARQEEAVQSINIDVSFSLNTQTLTLHGTGVTAGGPFSFVMSANSVTLALLKAG